MTRKLLFIFLFPFSFLLAQQNSISSLDILNNTIKDIDNRKENINRDSINSAFEYFQKQDDLYKWLYWKLRLGYKYYSYNQYHQALSYYEDAINNMWRLPENKKERIKHADLFTRTGVVFYDLEDHITAKKFYEKSLILHKDSLGFSEVHIAKYFYNKLGNIHSKLRNEAKSAYYFQEVKRIAKENDEWEIYGKACRNLNNLYKSLGKYNLALEALQDGLIWTDSMSIEKRIDFPIDIGLVYWQLGEIEKARQWTDQARKIIHTNKKKLSPETFADLQYWLFFNYGRINKSEKNFKKSEANYLAALKIIESDEFSGSRRELAIMNRNLGQLYLEQSLFDKATAYFQNAIQHLAPHLAKTNDPFLIPTSDLMAEDLISNFFQALGNVEVLKGKANPNTEDLNRGIKYYELADHIDQLLLENYATEQSNLNALSLNRALLEDSQYALHALWAIQPQDSLLQKMFSFSEQSRSALLRQQKEILALLKDWSAEDKKNYYIYKARRKALLKEIYALEKTPTEENEKTLGQLRADLLTNAETLKKLQQKKSRRINKPNLQEQLLAIQQSLSPNQALIEYFVGEKNLYIYLITNNQFKVYRKRLSPFFLQNIKTLRSSLNTVHKNTESFGQTAFDLYQYLLKTPLSDLPPTITRLVFAKDQALNYLPFEILLTQPYTSSTITAAKDYLINQYSISYANAASLFVQQKQRKQNSAQFFFAGYAPSYESQNIATTDTLQNKQLASLLRSGNYNLPWAKEEVLAITKKMRGEAFIGDEASEYHFKQNAANYDILLLSMHGTPNVENSNFSTLHFTPAAASTQEEDNLLMPIEINDLQLNANLVVLSACETGIGDLHPGEGVFSIARSFFYAGVPSTVMTLWQVHDRTTSNIMAAFFDQLNEGFPKDQALRRAKLHYLNNHTEGLHPFYWAGLQVVGNVEPLTFPSSISLGQYALMLPVLILIFLFLYLRKKKKQQAD